MRSWGTPEIPTARTLISWQNIHQDKLMFPLAFRKGKKGEKGIFYKPFLPSTDILDIAYFEEVKVPRTKENVLLILPQSDFFRVVLSHGRKPYALRHLMEKVLALPSLESPRCAQVVAKKSWIEILDLIVDF